MKHLDVVAGILIYNHKVLCMQRNVHKYDYLSYKFEFPGGKIEAGETQVDALVRELKEELDITVSLSSMTYFTSISYTYPDFSLSLHCYLCHLDSNLFTLKEHCSFKWCSVEDLDTLDWADADLIIVEKLKG